MVKAPDATTLLHFRHLLEKHRLTEDLFVAINAHLAEKGLILREGTIIDATLIAAPSSTKNKDGSATPKCTRQKKQPVAFRHESPQRPYISDC